MKEQVDIVKTVSQYYRQALLILAALTLGGVLAGVATPISIMSAIGISLVFQLFCTVAYGQAWKAIARRSPETLPKLYLAGSAFRLMAAAIVLLICCVVNRNDVAALRWLAVVFIAYYIVMLIFDAIFFAKVSKNSNK
ncbi:MAG: hypothetical protein IJ710_03175 [Prevotella sp.]|nr:hypothetical protein [Prevotella sp.]